MLVFLWLACYTEIKVLKDYLRAQDSQVNTYTHAMGICMLMAMYTCISCIGFTSKVHATKEKKCCKGGMLDVGIGEWGGEQGNPEQPARCCW